MKSSKGKSIFVVVAVALVSAFVIVICAVAASSCGHAVNFSAVFYFVCYDAPSDAHSAASISSLVSNYGGAGYIIEYEGKYFVTVSCYYEEKDALSVNAALKSKGLSCSVMEVEAGDYPCGGISRVDAEKYAGNLNTLYSLSKLCYELANSLDNGERGQTEAKSLLASAKLTLEGLARQNTLNCFSEEIAALVAECDDASYGYILSRDVRRLQIAIIDCIVNVKTY